MFTLTNDRLQFQCSFIILSSQFVMFSIIFFNNICSSINLLIHIVKVLRFLLVVLSGYSRLND